MTTLEESLTSESVQRLYDAFKAGVELTENTTGNHNFNRRSFAVVGPSLLRYVHARLLSGATLDPHPPDHLFPYRATESIVGIVRAEFPEGTDKHKYSNLAGDIARLLKVNRMVYIRPGAGGIWIGHHIPADEDMKYQPLQKGRPDPREEKRIEAEAEKAEKETKVFTDLRKIKLPSSDPESVMEFVERFVPAALKVQDEARVLKDEVLELKALLAETIEAAEKMEENGKWSGTADRIKDLMA